MKKNLKQKYTSQNNLESLSRIMMSKLSPVVMVGCQMRDTVYLIMKILLLSMIVICDCVPEHKGGVDSGLCGIHVISSVLALADLHLHELEETYFFLVFFVLYLFFVPWGCWAQRRSPSLEWCRQGSVWSETLSVRLSWKLNFASKIEILMYWKYWICFIESHIGSWIMNQP